MGNFADICVTIKQVRVHQVLGAPSNRIDTKSPLRLACHNALFEKIPVELNLELIDLHDVAAGVAQADLFIADFSDIRHAKVYAVLAAQESLPCLAVIREYTQSATELAMRLGAQDVIRN